MERVWVYVGEVGGSKKKRGEEKEDSKKELVEEKSMGNSLGEGGFGAPFEEKSLGGGRLSKK